MPCLPCFARFRLTVVQVRLGTDAPLLFISQVQTVMVVIIAEGRPESVRGAVCAWWAGRDLPSYYADGGRARWEPNGR